MSPSAEARRWSHEMGTGRPVGLRIVTSSSTQRQGLCLLQVTASAPSSSTTSPAASFPLVECWVADALSLPPPRGLERLQPPWSAKNVSSAASAGAIQRCRRNQNLTIQAMVALRAGLETGDRLWSTADVPGALVATEILEGRSESEAGRAIESGRGGAGVTAPSVAPVPLALAGGSSWTRRTRFGRGRDARRRLDRDGGSCFGGGGAGLCGGRLDRARGVFATATGRATGAVID